MKKLHWFIILVAVLILLCLLIWFLNTGKKNVILVNCQTDSLVDKIRDEAKAGDTVIMRGDCREDNSVLIDKDITLDGKGNTLSGTNTEDVIVVANATVTIQNITITNGKHGIVSKGAELTTRHVVVKDNLGVGVVAVGLGIDEKHYTEIINRINQPGKNDSRKGYDQPMAQLTAQSGANPPPLIKWYSCMFELKGNAGGGIYEQGMQLLFGHEANSCTITIQNNPWGLIAIGSTVSIRNATLEVTNNNMASNSSKRGIGVGVFNGSNLFGEGNNARLESIGHMRHQICKSEGIINESQVGIVSFNPDLAVPARCPPL